MSKLVAFALACAPLVVFACSSSDAPSTPGSPTDAGTATDTSVAPAVDAGASDVGAADTSTAHDSAVSDAGSDVVVVTSDGGDGISSPSFDGDLLALPHVVQCNTHGMIATKAADAGPFPDMEMTWTPGAPATTPATYHCTAGSPSALIVFQYQIGDGGAIGYTASSSTGACDITFTQAAAGSGGRNEGTFTATLTRAGSGDKVLTQGKFGCTVP